MSDFTKEELEGILEALKIIDKNSSIRPDIYWPDSLPVKIQSMINSYCEHELHECAPFNFKVCAKCDSVIGKL